MFTLRTRSVTAGLMLAGLVVACERLGPTGPPLRLAYGIFDAAHGGPPGFYFLPPDAAQPSFSGTFDAGITTLNPRIVICDVTTSYDVDCGGSSSGATPAIAVFSTTTPAAITLDPATPQYQLNWNPNCAACIAGHVYRVHVADRLPHRDRDSGRPHGERRGAGRRHHPYGRHHRHGVGPARRPAPRRDGDLECEHDAASGRGRPDPAAQSHERADGYRRHDGDDAPG